MTVKEHAVKAMQELPEDATYEEAMERLLVLFKLQRGVQEIEAGKTVTQDEAERRLSKWLK